MAWYYKEENNAIVCTVKPSQELVFFIPECYFDTNSAMITGNLVSLIGIFNFAIYENNKPISELKTFFYPSIFLTQPGSIEKWKQIQLTKNTDKSDYRALKYKTGDKIIVNMDIPQQVENMEEFMRLWIITGHIPNTVDYRNIWKYITKNASLNGNSYGLTNQLIGAFQTELCRDPSNYKNTFRCSKAKKNHEWNNFKPVSVKDVPSYISQYVSTSSENMDDSIVAATLMDEPGKFSPLEKVFTGK